MTDQRPLFAKLILDARENRLFLSQRAFADKIQELAAADGVVGLSCDQSTVSKWERGEFVPALRYRKYIGQALGMEPSVIFTKAAA